jgi:hypothetical protein
LETGSILIKKRKALLVGFIAINSEMELGD